VVDEGGAEVLPAVDGAGLKSFELVQRLAAHHHREVGRHDVVILVGSMYNDGLVADPSLRISVTIDLVNAIWLERGGA
jgi:hypothetical protein